MPIKTTPIQKYAGLHPVQTPPYAVYKVRRNGRWVRPFWVSNYEGKYTCGWNGSFTRKQLIDMCKSTLADLQKDP